VGQALAPFEHDDVRQKKQMAGRDDADNKGGKGTTFEISSSTCIAFSTHTCHFLICSHGRYFEQNKSRNNHHHGQVDAMSILTLTLLMPSTPKDCEALLVPEGGSSAVMHLR
jgi:hypothetical protein